MRILTVDVGTDTQDIILFDTQTSPENCVKLIMPSAALITAARIRETTRNREPLILTGWAEHHPQCLLALEEHLQAGLPAYSTPEAAAAFRGQMNALTDAGLTLIGENETRNLRGAHIVLRDLDLPAIESAFRAFGVDPVFDGYAVGCTDLGEAPAGEDSRLFRFDHLRTVAEHSDLRGYAYLREELPDYLTRARALLQTLPAEAPAIFMDSGPAAALGALQDPEVARHHSSLLLDMGNLHTLAIHMQGQRIAALYEHRTERLTTSQIEDYTLRLLDGSLSPREVHESGGNGVYYASPRSLAGGVPFLAVVGPQRGLLRQTRLLHPYFAAPHGDMMLSGCFGMIAAFAVRYPARRLDIERALAG